MNRSKIVSAIVNHTQPFDVLVIGGGASGLGVALDAVSRGLSVALLEKKDFGKGTSSKATKLLHGGVRYLAQGNISLVIEALKERSFVLKQAPHLSRVQKFIIPYRSHWQGYYYLFGLKMYEMLSGKKSLGRSKMISDKETIEAIPNIKIKGLKGGIVYSDGQFDDTRLCIDLVHTINQTGGLCINYFGVESFIHAPDGTIMGVNAVDELRNESYTILSKTVVNATGVWSEQTMAFDKAIDPDIKIVPARGSHITVSREFLGGDTAIMVPKTTDGRVLFLIPWHDKVIIGTTDVVSKVIEADPKATEDEIDFMLENAKGYLTRAPTKQDILSTFAGLRPLAAPRTEQAKSKEISRSHKIVRSKNGLYSLLGGKWTTFRQMGQDTIDIINAKSNLNASSSKSEQMTIMNGLPEVGVFIHPSLPYSWSQMEELCKTELIENLDDLLARRTRCIFLDKKATIEIAPKALELMRILKGKDHLWGQAQMDKFNLFADSF